MKFDAVIGNPPFQGPPSKQYGKKPGTSSIWPHMVILAIERAKKGGMIAQIHPSGWRGTGKTNSAHAERVRRELRTIDMAWLSMHDESDGGRVFKAATRFDCYATFNSSTPGFMTEIRDERGGTARACLKEMDFIPNFGHGASDGALTADDLLAADGEETVDLMFSRHVYHAYLKGLRNEESAEHPHPCVYSMKLPDGELQLKWADEDRGMFGIPKVIFLDWATAGIPYADMEGKYGMCQNAAAIVDDPEVLPKIARAMDSPEFRKLMDAVRTGSSQWNIHVIKKFRKDFWKSFPCSVTAEDLLAGEGEERVRIVHDMSMYDRRNEWMSKERDGDFEHPCIYSISNDGEMKLAWSSRDDAHFGIPKVVFGVSQGSGMPFVDRNGEYGLTQFMAGIEADPDDLDSIALALSSDEFREIMDSVKTTTESVNLKVLRKFRKDFWREFIRSD